MQSYRQNFLYIATIKNSATSKHFEVSELFFKEAAFRNILKYRLNYPKVK